MANCFCFLNSTIHYMQPCTPQGEGHVPFGYMQRPRGSNIKAFCYKYVMKTKPRPKPKKTGSKAQKPADGLVLAFGTFDLLHPGHLFYLSKAKKLGKSLVVIVARDANVKYFKGQLPVNNEKTRLTVVASLKDVDAAVLGQRSNFFDIIKNFSPKVIALGYDQWPGQKKLKKYLIQNGIDAKIVRLPAFKTNKFKSTHIKNKIKKSK